MPRDKCNDICKAKAPGQEDLRQVLARLLGPYSKLGDAPPSYWPDLVVFKREKKGYGYKQRDLLMILSCFFAHIYSDTTSVDQIGKVFRALTLIRPVDSGFLVCCRKHDRLLAFDSWVDELIFTQQEQAQAKEQELQHVQEEEQALIAINNVQEEEQAIAINKRKRSGLSTRLASLRFLPFNIKLPATCNKCTSFYPTIAEQYDSLLAVLGDMFKGLRISDFCCGKAPRYVYENLVAFKPKTIFLSDKCPVQGITRLDLANIHWPTFEHKVDVIISSLPYARGQCEPLLAACMKSPARFVCLKLLHSFERPVVGDSRAIYFQKLGLKILLPPARYPGFTRSLGDVEAWYIFYTSDAGKEVLREQVSLFHENLYQGDTSVGSASLIIKEQEYTVSCFKDRGLILWDSRKQASSTCKRQSAV